jgi:hypothetical protein
MQLRDAAGNERGLNVTANNRAEVSSEFERDVDAFDATTGWAVGNDATETIALSSNHFEGTGALTFNKVDGTGHTEAYIEKTISSLSMPDFGGHHIVLWGLYVSSLTDVAYGFVRLGTDSSNYAEWRVDDDDLTAGVWNVVAILAGNMEYTVTGNGLDASAITYAAAGVSFDAENDTLAGIALDRIAIHETNQTIAAIGAEVTSTVTSSNINVFKVGNKAVNTQAGNVGTGTQRVTIADDDTNLAIISGDTTSIQTAVEIMDDWDETNRAAVNLIASQIGVAGGAGAVGATVLRVTLASDDPAVTALELIDNAYTAGTTSLRTEEIDPLDQKLGSATLADVTDGADGTYYYYVDKEGFRYEGIQATLDGGSGTVTVTIECSIQDDGTAQASCSYVDVTSDVAGVASWTATFLFTDNDQKLGACKYVRYKVVAATAAADDADWTLFHKKWF